MYMYMYMYMCIYIYIYVYVYVYVCVYIYIYLFIHVHICVYVYIMLIKDRQGCPRTCARREKSRRVRSAFEVSSCFFGPRPCHIEIRHRVKKTSTINLFGFETLKLKIRRLKLWKPTVFRTGRRQACLRKCHNHYSSDVRPPAEGPPVCGSVCQARLFHWKNVGWLHPHTQCRVGVPHYCLRKSPNQRKSQSCFLSLTEVTIRFTEVAQISPQGDRHQCQSCPHHSESQTVCVSYCISLSACRKRLGRAMCLNLSHR